MEPLTVALLAAAGLLLYTNRDKIFGAGGTGGGTAGKPNANNVGPNGAGGPGNPAKPPSGGDIVQSVSSAASQLLGLFGGSKGQGTSAGVSTGTTGGGSDLTGNTSGETEHSGDPSGSLVGSDIPFGPETQPTTSSPGDTVGPRLPTGALTTDDSDGDTEAGD
jgi:hypothetical protein